MLLGAPLGLMALFTAALGHCAPDASCPSDGMLFGGALLIAAVVGLCVGLVANSYDREGDS
jgi:hypothetical protein